jgi:hypothetical protein
MIYKDKTRAMEVAADLNLERGYPRAFACLTQHGWTVIRSWSNPLGKYGTLVVANA